MSLFEVLVNILAIICIIAVGGFLVFFLGELVLSILDPNRKATKESKKEKEESIQQEQFVSEEKSAEPVEEVVEEKFVLDDEEVKPVNFEEALREEGETDLLPANFTEEVKTEPAETDLNELFKDDDFDFGDDFDFDNLFDEEISEDKPEHFNIIAPVEEVTPAEDVAAEEVAVEEVIAEEVAAEELEVEENANSEVSEEVYSEEIASETAVEEIAAVEEVTEEITASEEIAQEEIAIEEPVFEMTEEERAETEQQVAEFLAMPAEETAEKQVIEIYNGNKELEEQLLAEIALLRKELAEQKQEYERLISEAKASQEKIEEEKEVLEEIYVEPEEKPEANLTLAEYENRLEILKARLKANEKDLKQTKKEFIPLRKVRKNLDKDIKKLRRREALVAKQKVMLYGVNNIADIDPEKAKKLSEDLDLLDGLKVSVRHCEEVMEENKDRYPILETSYRILVTQNKELKEDIAECERAIALLSENADESSEAEKVEEVMTEETTAEEVALQEPEAVESETMAEVQPVEEAVEAVQEVVANETETVEAPVAEELQPEQTEEITVIDAEGEENKVEVNTEALIESANEAMNNTPKAKGRPGRKKKKVEINVPALEDIDDLTMDANEEPQVVNTLARNDYDEKTANEEVTFNSFDDLFDSDDFGPTIEELMAIEREENARKNKDDDDII